MLFKKTKILLFYFFNIFLHLNIRQCARPHSIKKNENEIQYFHSQYIYILTFNYIDIIVERVMFACVCMFISYV